MPKINVYLPDDLAEAVRDSGVPISAICQRALEQAVRRVTAIRSVALGDLGAEDLAARLPDFTERARTTLRLAVREARDQGVLEVGTEHLLSGILAEGGNLALQVLGALEIRPEQVTRELARAATVPRAPFAATEATEATAPFAATKATEGAAAETAAGGAAAGASATEAASGGPAATGPSAAVTEGAAGEAAATGAAATEAAAARASATEAASGGAAATGAAAARAPAAGGAVSGEGAGRRFSGPAANALELTTTEAIGMRHNYIGCEHLLVGLALEPDGTAGAALRTLGADARAVRRAVTAAVAGYAHLRAQGQGQAPAGDAVLAAVREELEPLVRRIERLEARAVPLDGGGTRGTD